MRNFRSWSRIRQLLVVPTCAVLCLLAAGCESKTEPDSSDDGHSAVAIKLDVLVVDDAPLAAAIRRRRGEWEGRTGNVFEVSEASAEKLLGSEPPGADLVIYPARYLGDLAEAKRIVPIRPGLLERDKYDASKLLELTWNEACRWGDQPMALPLGSPVFVLYYRADLLDKAGRAPPETWQEYAELAEQFAKENPNETGNEAPPWYGTLEPWAEGWAARMLLARAASAARHPSQFSALFDITSGEPLIASPPLVRALEAMVAEAQRSQPPRLDPAGVRQAFHAGRCAMAITWPSAATENNEPTGNVVGAVAELPGSRDVYDLRRADWETREDDESFRATLLGISGRLGSVSATSRNVPAAGRLLAWLSSPEVSSQISPVSGATTMFQQDHLVQPAAWVERDVDAVFAEQYGEVLARSLRRDLWLSVPRIPGSDEYLKTLDDQVQRALSGKKSAAAALQAAAAAWREIAQRGGEAAHRAAYRRSLGIEE